MNLKIKYIKNKKSLKKEKIKESRRFLERSLRQLLLRILQC